MKHYQEFKRTGVSFEEMVGRPDEISCAVGRVAMNFSDLEDELSKGITQLLRIDSEQGSIVCAELSFKTKLHLFASLFRKTLAGRTTQGGYDPLEVLDDLVTLCFRAEELRNQVLHSSWIHRHVDQRIDRRKVTAKASRGLRVHTETVDSGYLLDTADYVAYAAMMVDEFMLVLDDLVDA
jgi:hypothetical protein